MAVFFGYYIVLPKVYLMISFTSSFVYFEKVVVFGGIRLPDMMVVGKEML